LSLRPELGVPENDPFKNRNIFNIFLETGNLYTNSRMTANFLPVIIKTRILLMITHTANTCIYLFQEHVPKNSAICKLRKKDIVRIHKNKII